MRIRNLTEKISAVLSLLVFGVQSICPSYAQAQAFFQLPSAQALLSASSYTPALIKGLQLSATNPLRMDFIVDPGESSLSEDGIQQESLKLIKYFLASLTVPEQDMWVNLSPYEKDKLIPEAFGITEMGRDMLGQDYILKQFTASLLHPDNENGRHFWEALYQKLYEEYGLADVPVDSFSKVWIVPDKARVFQNEKGAFIVASHLKVLLDKDYLALEKHQDQSGQIDGPETEVTPEMLKSVIIPVIEREVNEGENFALLRQIYHSLILAVWYKNDLKESILGRSYVDRNITGGVDIEDKNEKQKIYELYLQAFKDGLVNLIQDEYDPVAQQIIPRKYFSGGLTMLDLKGIFDPSGSAAEVFFSNKVMLVTADIKINSFSTRNDSAMMTRRESFLRVLMIPAIVAAVANQARASIFDVTRFLPPSIDDRLKELIYGVDGGVVKYLRERAAPAASGDQFSLEYAEDRKFRINARGSNMNPDNARRPRRVNFQPLSSGTVERIIHIPRNIELLIDHSGSMKAEEAKARNDAIRAALDILGSDRQFTSIGVGERDAVSAPASKDTIMAGLPEGEGIGATFLFRSMKKAVEEAQDDGFVFVFTDGRSDVWASGIGPYESDRDTLWAQTVEAMKARHIKMYFIGINKDPEKANETDITPFFETAEKSGVKVQSTFLNFTDGRWDSDELRRTFEDYAHAIKAAEGSLQISFDDAVKGIAVSVKDARGEIFNDPTAPVSEWYGDDAVKPSSGIPIEASGANLTIENGRLKGSLQFERGGTQHLINNRWEVQRVVAKRTPDEYVITPVALKEKVILVIDYSRSMSDAELQKLKDWVIALSDTYRFNFSGLVSFGARGAELETVATRIPAVLDGLAASRAPGPSTPGWEAMKLALEQAIAVKEANPDKPVKVYFGSDMRFNIKPSVAEETFFNDQVKPLIEEAHTLGINISVFVFDQTQDDIDRSVENLKTAYEAKDATRQAAYSPIRRYLQNTWLEMVLALKGDIFPMRNSDGTDRDFVDTMIAEFLPHHGEKTVAEGRVEGFDLDVKDRTTGEEFTIRVNLSDLQKEELDKAQLADAKVEIASGAQLSLNDVTNTSSPAAAQASDAAQIGQDRVGGIDFDPALLNMEVEGQTGALNVSAGSLKIHIKAVDPVIIQIVPIRNVSAYLERISGSQDT